MVGDHQRLRAGLGRFLGVLDIEDALEDQLARPDAADPVDILPVQRGVELRRGPVRQRGDVVGDLDVADDVAESAALSAQHAGHPGRLGREIDNFDSDHSGGTVMPFLMSGGAGRSPAGRQSDQRAALGGDRALDQRLDEAAVLHDVELEPERLVDLGRDSSIEQIDIVLRVKGIPAACAARQA